MHKEADDFSWELWHTLICDSWRSHTHWPWLSTKFFRITTLPNTQEYSWECQLAEQPNRIPNWTRWHHLLSNQQFLRPHKTIQNYLCRIISFTFSHLSYPVMGLSKYHLVEGIAQECKHFPSPIIQLNWNRSIKGMSTAFWFAPTSQTFFYCWWKSQFSCPNLLPPFTWIGRIPYSEQEECGKHIAKSGYPPPQMGAWQL